MSATTRAHHQYDLLKSEAPADPCSELDHFSLSIAADEEPSGVLRSRNGESIETGDASISITTQQPEIVRYDSLFDLRERWKQLDCSEFALQLTVVLLLRKNFNGHLAGLIRRRHPALRLRIASSSGHLPGLTTIGDLALHSAALGWHLISFHRNVSEAVAGALEPLTWQERCVLFWPAGAEITGSAAREIETPHWERRLM